ncbi:host-nuclease inhibitor Gam family protein [Desulfatibacillum aliphaticivorans]|uniref:host-nuclease inhibitor Gam family protein n=1 Tax=Desulfatibacillum aliphaticivorans TaxID=218208 RepID=UPI0004008461|nr:host-nuclease inhibitor Gam family protein [Desulfatibacillum aliphaticivorans]
MARKKPNKNSLYPVRDLKEANEALREIAAIKREIEAVNANMNDRIDQAKADAEVAAAPWQTKMEAIENGLLAYAEMNKDSLFAKKRSVDLDFGSIGFRRSKEVKAQPKKTLASILEKLKSLGFSEGIRVKETVNKDVLRDWPEERLAMVDARIVEKDTFWIEPDETKLTDRAA